MKIIGMLAINNAGIFQVIPIQGMPDLREASDVSTFNNHVIDSVTGAVGGIQTPPSPEQDRVTRERLKPKDLNEVLAKNKK